MPPQGHCVGDQAKVHVDAGSPPMIAGIRLMPAGTPNSVSGVEPPGTAGFHRPRDDLGRLPARPTRNAETPPGILPDGVS